MFKKYMWAAAAALGMLLAPQPAQAQISFDIGPPETTGGATGFWTVTATNTGGFNWLVEIIAKAGTPPVPGPPSTEIFANQAHLEWLGFSGSPVQVISANAAVVSGDPTKAGDWDDSLAPGSNFSDHQHTVGPGLYMDGSNKLVVNVVLNAAVRGLAVDVTDGEGTSPSGGPSINNWAGGTSLVPEPASMTLAMAAFGPAGLALLKRRRRSSETEETEQA